MPLSHSFGTNFFMKVNNIRLNIDVNIRLIIKETCDYQCLKKNEFLRNI